MELQLWHQDRDSYVMRKGYKNREINILVAHVDSQPGMRGKCIAKRAGILKMQKESGSLPRIYV